MSLYRNRLPQLRGGLFLADGGLETTLIFHEGVSLPYFAAFTLLGTREGTHTLRRYFERYAGIARDQQVGLVLETPTWRANPDWATKVGYDAQQLSEVQRRSVDLLLEIRSRFETGRTKIVISGNVGPKGDGYNLSTRMSAAEAQAYHSPQIRDFTESEADMVAAFTMNYTEEAIGITLAAKAGGMPVAISFTTETDGKLPTGETLDQAIEKTDAASEGYPAYYMINCAHPTHLEGALSREGTWRDRIRGLRANASKRSHAELDESTDLDAGDPEELAWQYRGLQRHFRRMCVMGGCCGTDHRHVEAIGRAMAAATSKK